MVIKTIYHPEEKAITRVDFAGGKIFPSDFPFHPYATRETKRGIVIYLREVVRRKITILSNDIACDTYIEGNYIPFKYVSDPTREFKELIDAVRESEKGIPMTEVPLIGIPINITIASGSEGWCQEFLIDYITAGLLKLL